MSADALYPHIMNHYQVASDDCQLNNILLQEIQPNAGVPILAKPVPEVEKPACAYLPDAINQNNTRRHRVHSQIQAQEQFEKWNIQTRNFKGVNPFHCRTNLSVTSGQLMLSYFCRLVHYLSVVHNSEEFGL